MKNSDMNQRNQHKNYRQCRWRKGSTLILAVWSLFLLSTFAVQLGLIVRQKMTLVRRLDDREKRYQIAAAGVKYAITQLRKSDALFQADFLSERWADQEDIFKEKRVGKGHFTVSFNYSDGDASRIMYGIQDEESKINLNTANVNVLMRLLESTSGLMRREAEELAYNIVDWRDNDSFFQHAQYGAEDSDYRGKRFSYESKDSDFEVIDELLLVYKMNKEIFDQIKHFVTVHGDGTVNINTAPRQVLLALGVRSYVANNILSFRAGADQLAGTGDDNIFIQPSTIVARLSQLFDLSPSEIASLSNLVSIGQFVTKSENFMIRSTGKLVYRDRQTLIIAVADRTGKVKYWHEEI